MSTPAEYRFIFRGSALAAGGHIRRPNNILITSQAPTLVGVSGGLSQATAQGQDFGEIFRYASADSEVRADFRDLEAAVKFTHGNYAQNKLPTESSVRASISGVRIINTDERTRRTLSCGRITARLQSQWPGTKGETAFKSVEASVEKLVLDENELEVTFLTRVFASTATETKGKLRQAYELGSSFYKTYNRLFFTPAGARAKGLFRPKLPEAGGAVYVTIVDKIRWVDKPNEYATIRGNRIIFKDFGTIYLGEMFISDYSRRLTMMRVELGSPAGGSIDCVEVETDGHGYPPDAF